MNDLRRPGLGFEVSKDTVIMILNEFKLVLWNMFKEICLQLGKNMFT